MPNQNATNRNEYAGLFLLADKATDADGASDAAFFIGRDAQQSELLKRSCASIAATQASAGTTLTAGIRYYSNNGGTIASFSLPSTGINDGDVVAIAGFSTGGWEITQSSGQTIHQGANATTTGTGGSLASSNRWASVEIMSLNATSGDWIIISTDGSGSLTFT